MKRITISILGLILVFSATVFAQSSYLIKPGDKIAGEVYGESGFNFETIIDNDGSFMLPVVNKKVNAKCRTAEAVQNEVVKHYSKYLVDPMITVKVADKKPHPPITISGEVQSPRQVELKPVRDVRLLELLRFAGGTKNSAGGVVRVFRTQPPTCANDDQTNSWKKEYDNGQAFPSETYSLKQINTASVESNPVIYPGDIISVEKANPVYFTGEITSSQGIYIQEDGLSLSQAIAMLGGTRVKANTKDIKIYRKKGKSNLDRETMSINYDLIRKGEAKDVWLQPYDIIDIKLKKDSMAKTILKVIAGVGRTAANSFATTGVRTITY